MRTYPRNSPQAAARLVALSMLADGHLCTAELDRLHSLAAHRRLALGEADLQAVVHAFCEDLLATSEQGWGNACRIDERTMAGLIAEVDDPVLRQRVLALCMALVQADDHLAEGESTVIAAMVEQWGLHHSMLTLATGPARLQPA